MRNQTSRESRKDSSPKRRDDLEAGLGEPGERTVLEQRATILTYDGAPDDSADSSHGESVPLSDDDLQVTSGSDQSEIPLRTRIRGGSVDSGGITNPEHSEDYRETLERERSLSRLWRYISLIVSLLLVVTLGRLAYTEYVTASLVQQYQSQEQNNALALMGLHKLFTKDLQRNVLGLESAIHHLIHESGRLVNINTSAATVQFDDIVSSLIERWSSQLREAPAARDVLPLPPAEQPSGQNVTNAKITGRDTARPTEGTSSGKSDHSAPRTNTSRPISPSHIPASAGYSRAVGYVAPIKPAFNIRTFMTPMKVVYPDPSSSLRMPPTSENIYNRWKVLWGEYYIKHPKNKKKKSHVPSLHWYLSPFAKKIKCGKTTSQSATPGIYPKAVITTLIPATYSLVDDVRRLLENWGPNFLVNNPFPIRVFFQHLEGDDLDYLEIDQVALEELKSEFTPRKRGPPLDLKLIPTNEPASRSQLNRAVRMNYFLGLDVYKHPEITPFDYVIRLDSDFTFLEKVQVNVIDQMHENNRWIGFGVLGMPEMGAEDNADFFRDLYGWLLYQGILVEGNEKMILEGDGGVIDTLYAGPFEVFLREVFASDHYRQYFEDLVEPYLKRNRPESTTIREQFFKSMYIRFMVPPARRMWFCEIAAQHKINFDSRCRALCQ